MQKWTLALALWLGGIVAATAAEPRARVTDHGELLVDGKPYLPIFVWAQPSGHIPLFKELGFNTIHVGEKEELDPVKGLLDKAHAAGMMVLVGEERYQDELRGHPAALAWTVEHEPDMARALPYEPDVPADPGVIWIEGEKPASSTFTPNPWLNREFDRLSGKAWLSGDNMGAGDAVYTFEAKQAGPYTLFVREFNKNWANPTRWTVDGGEAQETPRTLKAAEMMDLGGGRGVGWVRYGTLDLKPGPHTLTLAIAPGRTVGDPAKAPSPDAVWAVDAICLTTNTAFPAAKPLAHRPTRPPEAGKAAFERMRQRDPQALTWIILTSQFHKGYQKLPLELYERYIENADIVSFDHYPVTGWNQPLKLPEVGLMTRMLRGMARRNQPVWTIVEASDQELTWTSPDTQGPTAEEMRAQVWMAIAGGARGIGYFTISFGRGNQFKWINLTDAVKAELKRTNGELAELAAPIVMGDTPKKLEVAGDETPDKAAEGKAILAIRKEYEGLTYVIAVNMTRRPFTPRFTLEAAPGGPVRVWKEDRTIPLENGSFTDEFAPLDVRVYVMGKRP